MEIDFFKSQCQSVSNKKRFGLCDEQDNKEPAYLDEQNEDKWIAVVENEELKEVHFIAIDYCIDIWRDKEKKEMDNRCDGMLWYDKAVIFVELKERVSKKNTNAWVKAGEKQLKRTIEYFEKTEQSNNFREKRAYIANKAHPIFKESQLQRMKSFKQETGYTLRIENRIKIPYINTPS
ncbi:hypothetical protein [Capnocytophaga sputigena]|jgi:hypothetical protein|uniref:hypothetical protein n=1 Tax=Capnocytophaga sputigena TaxID=1019 RepID=UPI002889B733|nr:hypothetical protein [Capnocytophaga sputigena]